MSRLAAAGRSGDLDNLVGDGLVPSRLSGMELEVFAPSIPYLATVLVVGLFRKPASSTCTATSTEATFGLNEGNVKIHTLTTAGISMIVIGLFGLAIGTWLGSQPGHTGRNPDTRVATRTHGSQPGHTRFRSHRG